jgi:hypothetical protein
MTIVEQLRMRFSRFLVETPAGGAGGTGVGGSGESTGSTVRQFSEGIYYGATKANPYKPDVEEGTFPSIPIKGKSFMPPSMNPQMRFRSEGPSPQSGRNGMSRGSGTANRHEPTAPPGRVNPHGSK